MTGNPWLVPVTALRRQPGTRRQEQRAGSIGELSVAGSVVPAAAEATAVAVFDSILGGIEVAADIRAPWRGECRRCLRPLSGELHCRVREPTGPGTSMPSMARGGAVRHAAGGQHQRQAGPGGSAGQGGAEDHGRDGGQGAPEGHRRSGGHDGLWDHGGHGGNGGRRHGDQARWDADLDEDTYPLEGDQLDLRPLVRDALLLELPLAPLCREDCRGLCAECGADLNLGPCQCRPLWMHAGAPLTRCAPRRRTRGAAT